MAHFAKINPITMKVQTVIVADPIFVEGLPDREYWLQTSINVDRGVYLDPETKQPHPEQEAIIGAQDGRQRKNFAHIGSRYDPELDAFIPPKPYASWVFNREACAYDAPVPMPQDGNLYTWDEDLVNWRLVPVDEVNKA